MTSPSLSVSLAHAVGEVRSGSPAHLTTSRRCWRASAQAPLRADRRGVARHARVLPRARRDHQAADPREGLHRGRGRGRLARRVSREPLRARRAATTPMPTRRSAASSAFRSGCGATPTCSTSSAGCARTTTASPRGRARRLLRARPLQPARVDGGGARVPATRSIRTPRAARASATRCFDHFGDDPQAYGYAAGRRPRADRASTRWWRSCVELRQARGRVRASATAGSPRTTHFFAEQNARLVRERRASTTATMFGGRVELVEPARPAHGRDARRARRPSSTPRRRAPKIVVWAHNSHLGDARATEMGDGGEIERRPARARSAMATTRCSSASPRTRAP